MGKAPPARGARGRWGGRGVGREFERGDVPMNVIDLLITIIVVTILVTIALGVMTYIAYKLRLSRRPMRSDQDAPGSWFFVVHEPSPTPPAEEHVA